MSTPNARRHSNNPANQHSNCQSLTLSNSERKRRKLRARRAAHGMPRSMSDGEHLGQIRYNQANKYKQADSVVVEKIDVGEEQMNTGW